MPEHTPPKEMIDAFHLMWDNFPEPASLVHKSREVVAVNKGHFLKPGTICARTTRAGAQAHKGCLANKAMSEGKAVAVLHPSPLEKKELITYWLPLDGYPDYFIHLSVRFTVDHENRRLALSPLSPEAREEYAYVAP